MLEAAWIKGVAQVRRPIGRIVAFFVAFAIALSLSQAIASPSDFHWNIPTKVPPPIAPENNPMSAEKVELGRYLFYEKKLSSTGEMSCATCHNQKLAFTDGRSVAIGTTGAAHPRNTMSLTNVAYNATLTWANPKMTQLEAQALVPMFGTHPVEMGLTNGAPELLDRLRQDPDYRRRFSAAFGASEINWQTVTRAIAAFERNLTSFDSPYDRYRYGHDKNAISAAAQRGEEVFLSAKLQCFRCHGGFNFSDGTKHSRSRPSTTPFHNTGLYNINNKGAYPETNTGLYEITHESSDMGRFKTPTLRNIALTAPYMHDGSVATLADAIEHYRLGGRGGQSPLKSPFVSGFRLSDREKSDLLAFLNSLTDETFINNPRLSDPNS
jgi:cytochrome c peroxidase